MEYIIALIGGFIGGLAGFATVVGSLLLLDKLRDRN